MVAPFIIYYFRPILGVRCGGRGVLSPVRLSHWNYPEEEGQGEIYHRGYISHIAARLLSLRTFLLRFYQLLFYCLVFEVLHFEQL